MITRTHSVTLRETWDHDQSNPNWPTEWHEFQPRCSCGWVGCIYMRAISAHTEGLQHMRGEL